MSTVTVSFSLDEETKKAIDQMAKQSKKSRSDILRDMARNYQMRQDWKSLQNYAQAKAREFNLQTEDDIEKFLG
ncbi:MAG: ribbon-helix-helix domain-containing protein [Patescibacteria group bacterium]